MVTNHHTIFVEVNGPRPRYRQVAEHLWGPGVNFDSDGNSESVDDPHWTELTVERRPQPGERVDIDPVSETPLVLKVVGSSPQLASRAAEFICACTNGRIIDE